MDIIKYEKTTYDGRDIFYKILDNGFDIFIGTTDRPVYHQYEPYIPYPELTYDENAKRMCEKLTIEPEKPFRMDEDEYIKLCANVDYLLLLNE